MFHRFSVREEGLAVALTVLRNNAPQFMLKSERDIEAKWVGEWNNRLFPRTPQPPRKDLPDFLPEGYHQAGASWPRVWSRVGRKVGR